MPRVVLATKHEKARLIAPCLAPLGYFIEESSSFDTDSLGTFAGDIKRTLTPPQAALTKARKACELTGSDWGLGSEGSFGGGPAPGLINWNQEVLCLYQHSTGLSVYAKASGPTSLQGFHGQDGLLEHLNQYPKQRWIMRRFEQIDKGLSADEIFELWQSHEANVDNIQIEPDLRAMHCPERQLMIAKAGQDLARRLSEKCPQCQQVNFVIKEKQPGLPCAMCSLPTHQVKLSVRICDGCAYRSPEPQPVSRADPKYCQFCNP
ncbi:hypothetical protein K6Y31_03150 [Motilimonas cestriensis]|uniref:DUF6671 domain-containing protein n=1 Tax=Motilimonas cestriensis TaxID=2742685 RepID=A0ABS8W4B7_9GAMM|nr:DUF6671 family protein [Motilimonas cestriensis]MCE2593806.1 hypothetical protein [Motilimonas cestriensis]